MANRTCGGELVAGTLTSNLVVAGAVRVVLAQRADALNRAVSTLAVGKLQVRVADVVATHVLAGTRGETGTGVAHLAKRLNKATVRVSGRASAFKGVSRALLCVWVVVREAGAVTAMTRVPVAKVARRAITLGGVGGAELCSGIPKVIADAIDTLTRTGGVAGAGSTGGMKTSSDRLQREDVSDSSGFKEAVCTPTNGGIFIRGAAVVVERDAGTALMAVSRRNTAFGVRRALGRATREGEAALSAVVGDARPGGFTSARLADGTS